MNNFTMVPQNRDTGKENREITLSLMLGETKSEYPKWRRELEYKASLAGLTQMINEPRKILLTREQWGAPQNPKAGVEHGAYVKTELQDAVRACELIRKGLTNYSTADIIARNDLDNVRPHEAITKIAEHFNKPDVGMLVDKVSALFAPSVEVTTQGVFNESMQMLAEIEPLLRQPIAAAAAAAAEEEPEGAAAAILPPGHMPFHPAFKAAVALCRTMANVARARDHTEMCSSIVQDTALRYPNMLANELTITHLNSTLTANMRAKPRGETASVFQAIAAPTRAGLVAPTKWTPKALKARSPDANPKAPCEIHPDAKVPHTNGECRQNPANKRSKQNNERISKLMMVCENDSDSSSEIVENYHFECGNFQSSRPDANKRKRLGDIEPRPSASAVFDFFAMGEFSSSRNGHGGGVIETHDSSSDDDDGFSIYQDSVDEDKDEDQYVDDAMLQCFFANYGNDDDDDDGNVSISVIKQQKIERPHKDADLKCDVFCCECRDFQNDYKARMVAGAGFPCKCGHLYEAHHLADPNSRYRQSAYARIEEELKKQCIAGNIAYCEKPLLRDHSVLQMRDEAETLSNSIRSTAAADQAEYVIQDNEETETTNQQHGVYPNAQGWFIEQPLRVMATGNVTNNVVETYSPTSSECDYSDIPPLVSDVSSDSD